MTIVSVTSSQRAETLDPPDLAGVRGVATDSSSHILEFLLRGMGEFPAYLQDILQSGD